MAGAIGAIGGALGSAGSAIGSALGGASAGQIVGGLGSAASLLSGGGGDTTTAITSVDPLTQARYQDLYNRGLDVYNTPFTPYTGERIAGFTPDQLEAQGQVKSMLDQSLRFDPRNQLNKLAGQGPESVNVKSLLDGDIGAYQNPFRQQVIDNTLSDLDRARQMQIQSDQDAAIGRGAFGGSRSAIIEAETNRNFADRAGNLAANLRSQGFDRATSLAGQDMSRDMQNRGFQAGLLGNQLSDQYRTLGMLSNIGSQQQGMQQGGLDAGYNEFMRAINYAPQQLGILSSSVFGMNPAAGQTTTTQQGTLGNVASGVNIFSDLYSIFNKG